MQWKKRQLEIQELRRKHGRDRSAARPFPDLSVEQRTAACSNALGGDVFAYKSADICTTSVLVGALHKSSLQVLLPSELTVAGRKV